MGVGFTTSAQAESLASPVDGSLGQTISLVVAPLAHALVLRQGGGAILLIAGAQTLGILDRLLDLAVASPSRNRDGAAEGARAGAEAEGSGQALGRSVMVARLELMGLKLGLQEQQPAASVTLYADIVLVSHGG